MSKRLFHPRWVHGHRVHHGLVGLGLAAAGVGFILHDWLRCGDDPLTCIKDFW